MKVQKALEGKAEKAVKLNSLQHGSVFRFPDVTFEEALAVEDASFYMVINKPTASPDRIAVISLDGKTLLERDGDRQVFQHQATVSISPNV